MGDSFFRRGVTEIWWADTITAPTAPVAADIDTDLTINVGDMEGWTYTNERIDVPNYKSAWIDKIPGPDQAADSSLTFYEKTGDATTDNPLRGTLVKGTTGFVFIAPYGLATAGTPALGDAFDMFPVEVASQPREFSAGNDPAKWMAEFSITSEPLIDYELAG